MDAGGRQLHSHRGRPGVRESESACRLDLGTSAARLDGGSDVTVSNLSDHFVQLGLQSGTLDESVYQWSPSDSIQLDTPNGALMPLATGTYLVAVDPNDNSTIVNIESGQLDVTGPGLERRLGAGDVVRLVGTNPIQVVALAPGAVPAYAARADFLRWNADRDRRYVSSSPTVRYVGEAIPGWEDLDAAGQWMNVASTGEVWCPTHVSNDWAPYRDGRWRWVEPWGWTWVDNAPWGYAPSHYGRWVDLGPRVEGRPCSWGWVPGRVVSEPVYAPALVSFVDDAALSSGGSPGVQAWFPLGPREPYYPWYHHSDRYLHDVNADDIRDVSNIDPIIHVRDVQAIHWVNRSRGFTAVPTRDFRAGDPVARAVVRVPPERFMQARIAPHPTVNPEPRLLAGGPPAARPPRIERPEMIVTRNAPRTESRTEPRMTGRVASVPGAAAPQPRAPLIARNTPPETRERSVGIGGIRPTPMEIRPPAPVPSPNIPVERPVERRRVEQSVGGEVGRPMSPARPTPTPMPVPERRPIITRNAPSIAPPAPAPAARAAAMAAHPGRPLEPQQIGNIRAERPAGPPRDREMPPHAAPPPRSQPQRPQPPQPQPPRSQPQPQPPSQAQPRAIPPHVAPAPAARPAPPTPAPTKGQPGEPARGRRGGGRGG